MYLPVGILCESKSVSFYCKGNSSIGNQLNNWRLLLNITLYIYFYVHLAKVLTKEVCARKHYWFKFLCRIVVCTLIWPASEMWRALFLQQELCEDSQENSVQLTSHPCFCFSNIECKFLWLLPVLFLRILRPLGSKGMLINLNSLSILKLPWFSYPTSSFLLLCILPLALSVITMGLWIEVCVLQHF